MASFNDPFNPASDRTTFVQRLPVAERTALAFAASVCFIAKAVVIVTLSLHASGAVGRGLYASMVLLGSALLVSAVLMALPDKPTPLRQALTGCGALVAGAAIVSALSLAEMLALAFLRTAFADPLAGDPEKLTALFAASFTMLATLGLLSAVARKLTDLPAPLTLTLLVVAALAALTLYSLSVFNLVVITLVSFAVCILLITKPPKKPNAANK